MKPRWLCLLPITQVNYQRSNYTIYVTSNVDLLHIHNTFQIGLLKAYYENKQQVFLDCHYAKPGPETDDRYEVEKAVNFCCSYLAREPLYQSRW